MEVEMEIQVRTEDVQAVLQSNPMMALQVENTALRRKLQETRIAFDAAMVENERLRDILDKSGNGSKPKEK
jgi:regulator of replication initiation timing